MLPTIKTLPPFYALAANDLLAQVQGSDSFPAGGEVAFIGISLPTVESTDESFTLSFMGSDHTFTFRTDPDDTGLELRTWPSGATRLEYLEQMIEDLHKYHYLSKFYHITLITPDTGIRLEAKEQGSVYTITLDTTISAFVSIFANAGVDPVTPIDYRIYMALADANKDLLAEEMIPVNNDNIASADFATYIEDLLSTTFHYPIEDAFVFKQPNSSIQLNLLFAEHYNGAIRALSKSDSFYALPGDLAQSDKDLMLDAGGLSWFEDMDMKIRWLTWSPRSKLTSWGTPERLYILNASNPVLNAIVTIKRREQVAVEVELPNLLDRHFIYEVVAGLHEVAPDIDPSTVTEYTVGLYEKGVLASELFTFVMDQRIFYKNRVLIFKNSFGVFDVVRCTGQLQISDRIAREEVEFLNKRVYRYKLNRTENTPAFKLSTGILPSNKYRVWLTELLMSTEVYWLTDDDYLLPIVITGSDFERYADKQFLYPVEITFKPDASSKAFSDIVGNDLHFLRDEVEVILEDEIGDSLTNL